MLILTVRTYKDIGDQHTKRYIVDAHNLESHRREIISDGTVEDFSAVYSRKLSRWVVPQSDADSQKIVEDGFTKSEIEFCEFLKMEEPFK